MPKIKNLETNEIINVSEPPVFAGGIWECGDQRFVDPEGVLYAPVVDDIPISAIGFKLLFTAAERVAIKTSVDPVVQDFYDLVQDQRLTEVNLALPSVAEALQYLEAAELIATGRAAQILSGVLP